MHGNNLDKVFRLAKSLSSKPTDVSRYVKHFRSRPLDIETPWFSWKAIDFLNIYLKPHYNVFEYGSGGSTAYFARRVASVTSVEDSEDWIRIVKDAANTRNFHNVQIIYAPIKGASSDFETSPYTLTLKSKYDVIVVDGSEDWPSEIIRPVCFYRAEKHVVPGGIIIVDDAWRYDKVLTRSSAKEVRRFEGIGPGRPGVTRTDVYFY